MDQKLDYSALLEKATEEAKQEAALRYPPGHEYEFMRKEVEKDLTRKLFNQMVRPPSA